MGNIEDKLVSYNFMNEIRPSDISSIDKSQRVTSPFIYLYISVCVYKVESTRTFVYIILYTIFYQLTRGHFIKTIYSL